MSKRQYGNPMRRGMNPALAQISQEKYIEKRLEEAYNRGVRDGAANATIVATVLFDKFPGDEDHQVFYDNMKAAVKAGVMDHVGIDRVLSELNKLLPFDYTVEDLIKLDPSLAGVASPEPQAQPAPPIGSKNGITVTADGFHKDPIDNE